jgi:molecular chaperone GrpE
MSETPQQPTTPGDEHISSPLPLDIESPPAGETLAAQPNMATDGQEQSPAPVNSAGTVAETGTQAEPVTPPPPEPEPAAKSSDLQSLTAQLAEVSNQRDAFQSQYLRIAADFDNFRKRNSKEKEETEVRTKQTTISELLSVVDNFERARTQIKPQNEGEMAIHKSYQGVYKQLVESLKRIGVSPMRPEGQQFDPNLHEAVMRQPTEEHPEGTVIEELQRGYYLGDRILRHSLVKVAAPPEQLSAEDASTFDSGDN